MGYAHAGRLRPVPGGYNEPMRFTKMHGLGNDYVYVNTAEESVNDPARLARMVSDRHTGIGSDGLILIGGSQVADVRMEMYNADGSRGRMCGNGIRCVAKYAVDRGLTNGPLVTVETDSGIKSCECRFRQGRVDSVRVDMGVPSLRALDLPAYLPTEQVIDHRLAVGGVTYTVTCVSMGNPHAVVYTEQLQRIDLVCVGPLFEHAPEFPEGINVHFVRINSRDHVTMRTWERGSGATRACGTGACAVCVAGATTGRTNRAITAELPGGALELDWAPDKHVYMTGPAVEVYCGDWKL